MLWWMSFYCFLLVYLADNLILLKVKLFSSHLFQLWLKPGDKKILMVPQWEGNFQLKISVKLFSCLCMNMCKQHQPTVTMLSFFIQLHYWFHHLYIDMKWTMLNPVASQVFRDFFRSKIVIIINNIIPNGLQRNFLTSVSTSIFVFGAGNCFKYSLIINLKNNVSLRDFFAISFSFF